MSLSDSIHQLTNEHLKTGPDNKPHKVPALLTELRNAVTPGHAGSAGGSDGGPPIPINPNALDLVGEIEKDARRDYQEITGELWRASLEDLLRHIAAMDLTPEWESYIAHEAQEWIDAITSLLWPVKPRRKLVGKVCPSCGWATYGEERKTCLSLGCWDPDGGVLPPGKWDVECGSCEAGWSGDQIAWLIVATDTPTETGVAEVAEVA